MVSFLKGFAGSLVAAMILCVAFTLTAGPAADSVYSTISAKALKIVNAKGEAVISMADTPDGPGVWMQNESGDRVTITAMKEQVAFYIMRKDSSIGDIGFALGKSGGSFFFVDAKGKNRLLPLDELANLLGE